MKPYPSISDLGKCMGSKSRSIIYILTLAGFSLLNESCGYRQCEWCDPAEIDEMEEMIVCNNIDIQTGPEYLCTQINDPQLGDGAAFGFRLENCDEGHEDLMFDIDSGTHGIQEYEIRYNIPGGGTYEWISSGDIHTIHPDQQGGNFTIRLFPSTGTTTIDINVEAVAGGTIDNQLFQKELDPGCTTVPNILSSSIDIPDTRHDGVLSAHVELCETLQSLTLGFGSTFGHGGKIQFRGKLTNGSYVWLASDSDFTDISNMYNGERIVTLNQNITDGNDNPITLNNFSQIVEIDVLFRASPNPPRNGTIPTGPVGNNVHQAILSINGQNIPKAT